MGFSCTIHTHSVLKEEMMTRYVNYIVMLHILVLPKTLSLFTTTSKTSLDHEASLCTSFSIKLYRINSSNTELSVHLSVEFWEAVRYFGVKDVHFVPQYTEEGQDVELPSIYCSYKISVCAKSFSYKIKILEKVSEITVYLQCDEWSSFCDLCEPALVRNMCRIPPLPPTTLAPVRQRFATTIGIAVTSFIIIMVLITVIVRKIRIRNRSHDEEMTEYHQLNARDTRNILLVFCIGNESEGARRELFTYISKLHFKILFINDHLMEISKNVNDWLASNVITCRCFLVVYSRTSHENWNVLDNTADFLLQRMKSISYSIERPKVAIISQGDVPPSCCNLFDGFHVREFTSNYKTSDELINFLKDEEIS